MKISIVGVGRVGATLAYTLVLRGLGDELVLVGRRREQAAGEADDLRHALAFAPHAQRVLAGSLEDTRGSQLLILCASVPTPRDAPSRAALAAANAQLFRELVPPLAAGSPGAILLVVTNPVDALTTLALRLSGFPAARVLGTGTLIDSARFRSLLSASLGIHPDDLRAYILGEHGPSQFPALSVAQAGGEPIADDTRHRALFEEAVAAGRRVFVSKGYTSYAIASATALIVDAIAHDTHRTLPVTTRIDGWLGVRDVCLSVPAVVGRAGVERALHPPLSEAEAEAFRASARAVEETLRAMG